jgi:hypothetical protein
MVAAVLLAVAALSETSGSGERIKKLMAASAKAGKTRSKADFFMEY